MTKIVALASGSSNQFTTQMMQRFELVCRVSKPGILQLVILSSEGLRHTWELDINRFSLFTKYGLKYISLMVSESIYKL